MNQLLKIENVGRSFGEKENEIQVLNDINMTVHQHDLIALKGRSGSGKTTLLNLLGGLDQPTKGRIYFESQLLNDYTEKQLTNFRKRKIGIIFQSYGLMPLMSVEENIEFGLRIANVPKSEWSNRIQESIELVGLTKRVKHLPFELSGGEQQRVAIARVIATKPLLILADEPTAELDSKMAYRMIKVFQKLTKDKETTIVMTTHNPTILEMIDKVYELEDGQIANQK